MLDVGILTVSDRCSRGERCDESGPALRALVEAQGWRVAAAALVPDERERIVEELVRLSDQLAVDVILTTGGTGFGPRDVTPEATAAVADRMIPGIPEMLRLRTASKNPRAWLSRATAGLRGRTLIINLPGSPLGAAEWLAALRDLLPHAVEMIQDKGHQPHAPLAAHP